MTGMLLDPARGALMETLLLLAPILGIGLVVGVIVSIGQAVTSVQEQSLSFLPKLVAMIVVAVLLLGWMVARLGDFTRSMFAPDIFG